MGIELIPPEGLPNKLYKLSFSRHGDMLVTTNAGIYKRAPRSERWILFFKTDERGENRMIEMAEQKNGSFLIKEAPGSSEVRRLSPSGKILEEIKLPFIPSIFGDNGYYACAYFTQGPKSKLFELVLPPFEEAEQCEGGVFHQGRTYIFTDRRLLEVKGKKVKVVNKFRYSHWVTNRDTFGYPDLRKFDLNGNLYATAEQAYNGDNTQRPTRFVVKARPDENFSKILDFGFRSYTPKFIELVGVVDNDVFINLNGQMLYVSRDGGESVTRIDQKKTEHKNIELGKFYEIIKGPDNLLYAVSSRSLYKSRDRGETWEAIDRNGIPTHYRVMDNS